MRLSFTARCVLFFAAILHNCMHPTLCSYPTFCSCPIVLDVPYFLHSYLCIQQDDRTIQPDVPYCIELSYTATVDVPYLLYYCHHL
jgi:hypothetical protein